MSIKVHQLPPEQASLLPAEGLHAWTVCRACPQAKPGPVVPLSQATCGMSLGRFLESNFYNTAAGTRQPGCAHSLHLDHERYISCGPLVCSLRFSQCVVFGITPPLPPRDLLLPPPPPPPPPPQGAFLSAASAAAAHALCQPATLAEVSRGVTAILGGADAAELADVDGGGGGAALTDTSSKSVTASDGQGGGFAAVGEIHSHDALCELMRWADAAPKVDVKFEDDSPSAAIPLLPGSFAHKATLLYPASFAALRERFCEGGDAAFIESLRTAVPWNSGRGGKSGSTFLKSLDDRFLLKQYA